jgi:hypothetical protein
MCSISQGHMIYACLFHAPKTACLPNRFPCITQVQLFLAVLKIKFARAQTVFQTQSAIVNSAAKATTFGRLFGRMRSKVSQVCDCNWIKHVKAACGIQCACLCSVSWMLAASVCVKEPRLPHCHNASASPSLPCTDCQPAIAKFSDGISHFEQNVAAQCGDWALKPD